MDIETICKSLSNISIGDASINIRKLSELLQLSGDKKRDEICDKIIKNKVIDRLYMFYEHIHKSKHGIDLCNDFVMCLYAILINITDNSEEISSFLMETSLPDYLIEDIINCTGILQENTLIILTNIARYEDNGHRFKNKKLKQKIFELLKNCVDENIKITCLLILSITLEEDEKNIIINNKNIVALLFYHCILAKESDRHRCNGFSLWELLNGLRCVCVNDDMKDLFKKEEILKFLNGIINNPYHIKEIEQVLWIISNLCFDKELRSLIEDIFNLKQLIEKHNGKSKKITALCNYISRKMGYIEEPKNKNNENEFDVFLSHAGKDKNKVMELINKLKQYNIKMWLDSNEMNSDLLDSMSKGIENSKLFVMCVSECYRTSYNCRNEAEFAYRMEKPFLIINFQKDFNPRRWLGFLMGSKKQYKFYDDKISDDIFNKMIVEMNRMLSTDQNDVEELNMNDILQITNKTETKSDWIKILSGWDEENVENWMKRRNLNDIWIKLNPCRGSVLIGILNQIHYGGFDENLEKLGINYNRRLEFRGELLRLQNELMES